MDNVLDILTERLPNMRLKTVVQTGYINVALTNLFTEHANVKFYTPAVYNPFEENNKVEVINDRPHFADAHGFGNVDILSLNGLKDYNEARAAMSAWLINVRINGLIVIAGTEPEGVIDGIMETLAMVELEAFKVENFDNFMIVTPIK